MICRSRRLNRSSAFFGMSASGAKKLAYAKFLAHRRQVRRFHPKVSGGKKGSKPGWYGFRASEGDALNPWSHRESTPRGNALSSATGCELASKLEMPPASELDERTP